MSALNNARVRLFELEYEARQQGRPVYFEALLPARDPASENLAAQFEMQPVDEQAVVGMRLYRGEL
jgi:hypothetical protein